MMSPHPYFDKLQTRRFVAIVVLCGKLLKGCVEFAA
jgi:hypothetical protein